MSSKLPKLYLARHGDTDWTDSRRKTGRTDLPLNERGEQHARQLGERCSSFLSRRFLRAHCNAPARHVHWPALAKSPR